MRNLTKLAALAVAISVAVIPGASLEKGLSGATADVGAERGGSSDDAAQEGQSEEAFVSEDDDGVRSWTVAMYWDADNDLDSLTETFVQIWLDSLTNRVDVAMSIYIDGVDEPTTISSVTEDGLVVEKSYDDTNSSDPKTLQAFLEFTMTSPKLAAEHYCLIVQDHGLGYLGMCVDEGEPTRPWLTIDGFGSAIAGARASTGKMLDIIELDACTMAMVEVAYEIRGQAGYLVAAQKAVPFDGLNYRALLGGLSEDPDIEPLDLACKMVDDFGEWYSAPLGTYPTLYPYMQDFACLSVMDLSKMQEIGGAFAALKDEMLPVKASLKGPLTEAAKTSFSALWMNCMACDYGSDIKVMLTDFAGRIRDSHPTVAALADAVVAAFDDIVVHNWASWRFRGRCEGMSVFVSPGIGIFEVHWDSTWNRVYDQLGLDFVADSGWAEVLDAYFLPQKCPG